MFLSKNITCTVFANVINWMQDMWPPAMLHVAETGLQTEAVVEHVAQTVWLRGVRSQRSVTVYSKTTVSQNETVTHCNHERSISMKSYICTKNINK